jgi:hypothetical protein
MVSTPAGLYIGVANPFGPKIAVKAGESWKYEVNPKGGLEIWQGLKDAEAEEING